MDLCPSNVAAARPKGTILQAPENFSYLWVSGVYAPFFAPVLKSLPGFKVNLYVNGIVNALSVFIPSVDSSTFGMSDKALRVCLEEE